MAGHVGQAKETGTDAVAGRMKRRGLIAGAAALVAALAVRGGTDPEHVSADGFNWSMPYTSGSQNQVGGLASFYNKGHEASRDSAYPQGHAETSRSDRAPTTAHATYAAHTGQEGLTHSYPPHPHCTDTRRYAVPSRYTRISHSW